MCESVGTCYEEYVQDASRHYQNWVVKTNDFNWPIEALFIDKGDLSPEETSGSYYLIDCVDDCINDML